MSSPRLPRASRARRSSVAAVARAEALESRRLLSVTFPAGSGVVDVTQAPYFAIPNDGLDDTAALNQAIFDNVGRSRVIYLPDGVYNISNTLDYAPAGRSENKLWVQGQSRSGTVLKLSDNNPLFSGVDAATTKVVFDTYNGNNGNSFGNYIMDLTIDVGAGNPGATALQFQTNNYGAVRNVTLKTSDPASGDVGLNIAFNEPGPMLIHGLEVQGFRIGILAAPQQYSAVLEDITLTGQREAGIGNYRLPMTIRNLTSVNSVPAIVHYSSFGWGNIVLIDSQLLGGAPGTAAVRNETGGQNSAGYVLLRNVTTSGYTLAVDDRTTNVTVPGGHVAEYRTGVTYKASPASPDVSLNLPIVSTPVIPADPVATWASVTSFGATPNDNLDDTRAIQAALDSGASTVFLPNGTYIVSDTLVVGGNVKRVLGAYAQIDVESPVFGSGNAVFKFVPGNQPAIEWRNIDVSAEPGGNWVAWEQATLADLIIKDTEASGYRNSVRGGRVFIEDISGTNLRFDHQHFFGRQINPEQNTDPKIDVIGGSAVILGLKTENATTLVRASSGARVEVLGGLTYPVTQVIPLEMPAFEVIDAAMSFSTAESRYGSNQAYYTWLRETRDGVTTTLTRDGIPMPRNFGANLILATAYRADGTPPTAAGGVAAAATGPRTVELSWAPATDPDSGIDAYKVFRDGVYLGLAPAASFTDTAAPDGLTHTYSVVPVNGMGLDGPAAFAAPVATPADTARPAVARVVASAASKTITLTFSEPLAPGPATTAANYVLSPATPVQSAALSRDGRTVVLVALGLQQGTSYEVAVSNLTDRATAPNAIPAGTPAAFSTPPVSVAGTGDGLLGTYFPAIDFTGTSAARVDPTINFSYGTGAPLPGFPADNFSVRWTGSLLAPTSDFYTIIPRTDDGVRVWLDGRLIVDAPFFQAPTDQPASVRLEAGRRYDLRVDYFEGGFGAAAQLFWQSSTISRQIIPQQYLYSTAAPGGGEGGQSLTLIRTSQGAGADAATNAIGPEDQGANGSSSVHNYMFFNYYHNQLHLRFDLSTLDRAGRTVVGAELVGTHTGPFTATTPSPRRFNVYGVLDSLDLDNWTETGPGYMTWATAPGSKGIASGGNALPSETTFLGYIDVDNTGNQLWFRRDGSRMTTAELASFLATDTDNRATLLIKRQDPWYDNFTSWAMKENTNNMPAFGLLIRTAPSVSLAPAAVALDAASDTGSSSSDRVTRLNNAAPASALRFTVSGTTPGATVTVYADGVAVGSAVATADTTRVVTAGGVALPDGVRALTARQTLPSTAESPDSAATTVTIDTTAPTAALDAGVTPRSAALASIGLNFSEPVLGVTPTLALARDGAPVPLSGLSAVGGGATWSIAGLAPFTAATGVYAATFAPPGVTDLAGNAMGTGAAGGFAVNVVSLPTSPDENLVRLVPDAADPAVMRVFLGTSPTPALTGTYAPGQKLRIDGSPGADRVRFEGNPAQTYAADVEFRPAGGTDALDIASGTFVHRTDLGAGTSVRVFSSARVEFPTSRQTLATLTLDAGAVASSSVGLVLSALSIANDGAPLASRVYSALLDLGRGTLVVRNADADELSAMTRSWWAGGTRTGGGLGSAFSGGVGRDALATVGVLSNRTFGFPRYSLFDTTPVSPSDVLVRYTYRGDNDLDGRVDLTEINRALFAWSNNLAGWANADSDHSGLTTGPDYRAAADSFNGQTAPFI